ncbi:copper homeostasis protein [Flavobacterium fryxellicola]|uniref:copper homeostasis protein CutC n=1 Tax=Flavobacterium fryxellicola TaxID=249352 RepID=UPI0009197AB2|nr:copper homeostasis protein CutC [Flavobacterium fryxellicola]SHN78620.1 copper homeostasis protein [Flavobacterium fryxellicola]
MAPANGAERIELCANRNVGGVTLDLELFKTVRHKTTIVLYVMIRSRSGNFVYSDFELEQMKASIKTFKEAKANGFVFGILKESGLVNQQQNCDLVALAKPLPCTFHRAFDEVENTTEALKSILKCGFETSLTSGRAENCVDGIAVLAVLIKKSSQSHCNYALRRFTLY